MIGIVGGGISGLAVAHGLEEKGVPHVLFEAAPEAGGVMRTIQVDGLPLDVGPQRTRLTREVRKLVEAAGLGDEVLTADDGLPLWVFRDGKLRRVPFRLPEAFTTDLLGWRAKLRILLEPFTGGIRPDETVERFFVRKFGREAYENMIGPLYGGLYASDPSHMYARHGLRITLDHFGVEGSLLLAMLRRGSRARQAVDTIGFRDGLQALPRGLAAADRSNVRLSTPVRALLRRSGGGWRLRVDGPGGDEAVDVDTVILSCPSRVAAKLLEPAAAEAARRIGSLRTNRLAVVHLRSDFRGEGFGYQVAFGEPLETRGCTWNASIFDRPGVFTCYLG
ncbi:MAG TPA: protoporphyrinogen oxidase, partial [Longimicrobiales bacterium]|nr:protoporphyrinogen oxidase [Longimicrobiales bacterium]